MQKSQRMSNQYFTGMTIIGSKKERMAKMVSNINKMDLVDIITIPETKEEINALNKFLKIYTIEQATEEVFNGISYIISEVKEINEEIQGYLTRDAEDMRAETMPRIISALNRLGSITLSHTMEEYFVFLNTSSKAGDFLVYIWEFFQNIKEIIGRLYDTRSMKVTEYKKAGRYERENWRRFISARDLATETAATVNELAKKLYETRKAAEELK